ncbi:unnamed protein product [Soboliphyme baturini]|uniref:PH domain-containing protein n=1 Tax=Soboliphyme baturini TaxID=241478 RepID=A0A183I8V5_9BILA|nr:unnamed protein product [Soboliphyme baturini]
MFEEARRKVTARVLHVDVNHSPICTKRNHPEASRGWMNCIAGPYDPATYHVKYTHTVFVQLENEELHLSIPRNNIHRHATFKCFDYDASFDKEQMFDLREILEMHLGAMVTLRPKRLAHRRWWSRKYPICIKLRRPPADSDENMYTTEEDFDSAGTSVVMCITSHLDHRLGGATRQASLSDSDLCSTLRTKSRKNRFYCLMLFARSSREKEHWFHKYGESISAVLNYLTSSSPQSYLESDAWFASIEAAC